MCDFLSVDQYKIIDAKIVHSQGMTNRFQMWLSGGGGGGTIKPYLFAWPKRWLPRMFYRKKNIL